MDTLINSTIGVDEQFRQAHKAGLVALKTEPRAKAVRYDAAHRQIIVELTNNCIFIFPADSGQGLKGADDGDLADVSILGSGYGLHWEKLDVDLNIAALVVGIFGSSAWMRELARRGGASKSPAKSDAARINGAKGGRPQKSA